MAVSGVENTLVDTSLLNKVLSVLFWDTAFNSLSSFLKYRSLPKKSLGFQYALPFSNVLIIGNKTLYFQKSNT